MKRKAIYAGSFDCYTKGHHEIVKKAARLFDELHILIAVNSQKKRRFPADDMADAIAESIAADGITNCIVLVYDGITADYCLKHGIDYLVRGLRNSIDYSYEETIACAIKMIAPKLETIYLRAGIHSSIYSYLVEEMFSYGKDVSKLVPPPVFELLKNYSPK